MPVFPPRGAFVRRRDLRNRDSEASRVENLSKCYRLAPRQVRHYRTLRESLASALAAPFRRLLRGEKRNNTLLWALNDVSFEVHTGEVIGIVGRNGAGKSTLLKVLSRITEPTRGRALLRGRVGSLLEVGTGFHMELTGRENIYLNGAILGMTRREVARKFDEIVAFAEVERFLDTPVKRYSSGMYMRLAFAVAASLEPEILLVDEVLAVGDAGFQRKCLERMRRAAASGRTVLVVSHDLSAVTRLCRRAILLDAGRVVRDGPANEIVEAYLHSGLGLKAEREWPDPAEAPGDDVVRLTAARVRADDSGVSAAVDIRRPVFVEIDYEVLRPGHVLVPNYHFFTGQGVCAFVAHDWGSVWRRHPRPAGRYRSRVRVPGNFLSEGTTTVGIAITTYFPFLVHLSARDAVAFQVIDTGAGDSARGDFAGTMPGVVRPLLDCETEFLSEDRACA